MLKKMIVRGLRTGFVLAATTTAAIMAAGDRENGAPWSAINAIVHAVDGEDVTQPSEFSPREAVLGILINGTAMALWGVLYEGALMALNRKSSPVAGAAASAIAYVIDYRIVPTRLTPGIEKKLSRRALLAVYGILAATLAASSLWNGDDREDPPGQAVPA